MGVGIASTAVYFWADGSSTSFNGKSAEDEGLRGLYVLVDPITHPTINTGYYGDFNEVFKSTGVGTAVNGISTVAYYYFAGAEGGQSGVATAVFVRDYNGAGEYYAWHLAHQIGGGGTDIQALSGTVFDAELEGSYGDSNAASPATYSGFYGNVQSLDATGDSSGGTDHSGSDFRWDGTSDVVIYNGGPGVNEIGIFTAVTGYYVNPSNSLGVAASTGQNYWYMAGDVEGNFTELSDDAGFFWDNPNTAWSWIDDVRPGTDDTGSSVRSDGVWGSISTAPTTGDAGGSGQVVYLSLDKLSYEESEGGGGQVTSNAPTLKLKRGLQTNLPTLAVGEPGFTTDTYRMYIGSHDGNKLIGGNDFMNVESSTVGGSLKVYEGTDNGTDFLELKSPDSLAGITTYTLPAGASSGFMKISSSSNNGSDYEVTLGFAAALEDVVDDTTPQLGGDLDLNSSDITGTGNINITGDITASDQLTAVHGNFTGVVTATNVTVGSTDFATLNQNVDNIVTLSGVAVDSVDLGTFTGSTIGDNVTIKTALQDLETQLDSVAGGGAQATSVSVGATDTDATHYLTFVTDNNTNPTQESLETDAGVTYNPSSNLLTVGEISATTLDIGGTNVTSTAAELNLLDGSTADGEAVASKALIVSPDLNLNNLGVVTATTFTGNLTGDVTGNVTGEIDAAHLDTDANGVVMTGITTVLQLQVGTLGQTLVGITTILDEDGLDSDSATALATQQSIKAYVDAVDLTTTLGADSGSGSVATSQTLTISGTANEVNTSVADQTVTIGLPDTVNITTELDVPTIEVTDIQAKDGTASITITNSTGAVSIADSLTVSGDLIVNGTLTEVNTTQLNVEDTLIELQRPDGGELGSDTNKDVGLLLNYYDSANKKAAVFWDDSAARIVFADDVTESSGVLTVNSTSYSTIEIGALTVSDSVGVATAVITVSGSDRVLQNVLVDCGAF